MQFFDCVGSFQSPYRAANTKRGSQDSTRQRWNISFQKYAHLSQVRDFTYYHTMERNSDLILDVEEWRSELNKFIFVANLVG
jgi:hypothetical protein